MHVAIVNHTIQPGKRANFIAWYESLVPHLKELVPGLIAQYVVETDDKDTVMSFAIYESKDAALTPPSDKAKQAVARIVEFVTEGGISERKVYPMLAYLQ